MEQPFARCIIAIVRSSFRNPWDVGTARLLQSLGFEALATTSAGFAFSIGKAGWRRRSRNDACVTLQLSLLQPICPSARDLENGYGDEPSARC